MTGPDRPGAALRETFVEPFYDRLRRRAQRQLGRERRPPALEATALVHEAWLRLAAGLDQRWASRSHLYNAAALAMRRVLVDHARRRRAARRGEGAEHVPIELVDSPAYEPLDVLLLDEALERLAATDPRAHRVVRLRFFAGLSVGEVARVTGLSPRTVKREWRAARQRLHGWLGLRDWLERDVEPAIAGPTRAPSPGTGGTGARSRAGRAPPRGGTAR